MSKKYEKIAQVIELSASMCTVNFKAKGKIIYVCAIILCNLIESLYMKSSIMLQYFSFKNKRTENLTFD